MSSDLPGFFQGTEMPTAGWWEALWPDPAGVVAAVGIKPGMEVIDLCSGDGWFTLQIAKIAQHVAAIDIDPNLLEVARHRFSESGAVNCDFVVGNAFDIAHLVPYPVHYVFMANAFHGVPDQPRLARSVHDALKPSGQFTIVNWHQRPRGETTILGEPRGPGTELRMAPDQTVSSVVQSGLCLRHIIEIPPYHYGAIFERTAVDP
jgi:ubiquinone/menaquinone biosynthesis C-methylase UbiE